MNLGTGLQAASRCVGLWTAKAHKKRQRWRKQLKGQWLQMGLRQCWRETPQAAGLPLEQRGLRAGQPPPAREVRKSLRFSHVELRTDKLCWKNKWGKCKNSGQIFIYRAHFQSSRNYQQKLQSDAFKDRAFLDNDNATGWSTFLKKTSQELKLGA